MISRPLALCAAAPAGVPSAGVVSALKTLLATEDLAKRTTAAVMPGTTAMPLQGGRTMRKDAVDEAPRRCGGGGCQRAAYQQLCNKEACHVTWGQGV